MYSSHSLFDLSFFLAYMEASFSLSSLWQLISADDLITFELIKRSGSLASFLTVFDHLKGLPYASYTLWVLCVRNVWVYTLGSGR